MLNCLFLRFISGSLDPSINTEKLFSENFTGSESSFVISFRFGVQNYDTLKSSASLRDNSTVLLGDIVGPAS